MTHRWLTRALVAVAVPALLAPALVSSASAAPTAPPVPTLEAVAKIYPHLEGGSADITRGRKIRMPEKSCKSGSVIKGATGQGALYAPDLESVEDRYPTGQEPIVSVTAAVFPTARLASQYLRASGVLGALDCELPGVEPQTKKIRFRLGSERSGLQMRLGTKKNPLIMNVLDVRSGKRLVSVTIMSTTGKAAPSIAKSVDLTRLALKTAR